MSDPNFRETTSVSTLPTHSITLYPDSAAVIRHIPITIRPGTNTFTVKHISKYVLASSIQATAHGVADALITSTSTVFVEPLPATGDILSTTSKALNAALSTDPEYLEIAAQVAEVKCQGDAATLDKQAIEYNLETCRLRSEMCDRFTAGLANAPWNTGAGGLFGGAAGNRDSVLALIAAFPDGMERYTNERADLCKEERQLRGELLDLDAKLQDLSQLWNKLLERSTARRNKMLEAMAAAERKAVTGGRRCEVTVTIEAGTIPTDAPSTVIQLASGKPGHLDAADKDEAHDGPTLRLSYLVSHAGWKPKWDLAVDTVARTGTLSLTAEAHNACGEDFTNTSLTFSTTGRFGIVDVGGALPKLKQWRLGYSASEAGAGPGDRLSHAEWRLPDSAPSAPPATMSGGGAGQVLGATTGTSSLQSKLDALDASFAAKVKALEKQQAMNKDLENLVAEMDAKMKSSGLFETPPAAPVSASSGTSHSREPRFGASASGTAPPASTSGGLFGRKTAAPPASSSPFGAPASGTAPPASTSGGLFGTKTAAPPASSGPFGAPASGTPPPIRSSGGLLGASTSQTAEPPSALFGGKSTTPTATLAASSTYGLFGTSASRTAAPTASSSAFGTSTAPNAAPPTSSFAASIPAAPNNPPNSSPFTVSGDSKPPFSPPVSASTGRSTPSAPATTSSSSFSSSTAKDSPGPSVPPSSGASSGQATPLPFSSTEIPTATSTPSTHGLSLTHTLPGPRSLPTTAPSSTSIHLLSTHALTSITTTYTTVPKLLPVAFLTLSIPLPASVSVPTNAFATLNIDGTRLGTPLPLPAPLKNKLNLSVGAVTPAAVSVTYDPPMAEDFTTGGGLFDGPRKDGRLFSRKWSVAMHAPAGGMVVVRDQVPVLEAGVGADVEVLDDEWEGAGVRRGPVREDGGITWRVEMKEGETRSGEVQWCVWRRKEEGKEKWKGRLESRS
ncbi:hypothetical protein EDC01DRAFT_647527 [Geopyxis carbonaria]|nr:hypothetical protein EDC01DRAFT_647527 [Geopyxis carbonaria]